MLGASIKNIQSSWVKEGPRLAQYLLTAGANDVGGTLMNESISTSAGAQFGQMVPPVEFRRLIRDAGRTPAQRKTNYELIAVYDGREDELTPLDNVVDADSRFGSYARLAASTEFRFGSKNRTLVKVVGVPSNFEYLISNGSPNVDLSNRAFVQFLRSLRF